MWITGAVSVGGMVLLTTAAATFADEEQFAAVTSVELRVDAPAPYGESTLVVQLTPPAGGADGFPHRRPALIRPGQPLWPNRVELITEDGAVEIPAQAHAVSGPFAGLSVTTDEDTDKTNEAGRQPPPILAINLHLGRRPTRIFIRGGETIGHYDGLRHHTVRYRQEADDEVIAHGEDPYAPQPEVPAWFDDWRAATRQSLAASAIELVAHPPEPYGETRVAIQLSGPSSDADARVTGFEIDTAEGPIDVPSEAYRDLRQPHLETARVTYSGPGGRAPGRVFVAVRLSYQQPDGSTGLYEFVTADHQPLWYSHDGDITRLDDTALNDQ